MKMTLLDMVVDILDSMESDVVSSIEDTEESLIVASTIRSCYNELMSNRDWPHLKKLLTFEHSGSPNLPTHMKAPEGLRELLSFEYDASKEPTDKLSYRKINFKEPDVFLRMTSNKSKNSQTVKEVVDPSGVRFAVVTNSPPTYWTTFDDKYIVCDSYDQSVDDALQEHRTRVFAYMSPEWRMLDDFVPDLPEEAFPGLLEEARSTCFFNQKQMANDKAEQKAVRQRRRMSMKSWALQGGIEYPNFGRRRIK